MLAQPEKVTTTQVMEKNVNKAMEVYLKNSFVCFSSIRNCNKDIDDLTLVLFSNFPLYEPYKSMFESIDVKNVVLPFGEFAISDNFAWSIVQYRYDVMKYIAENFESEDIVVQLDTDIYCAGSLKDMFEELTENLLLYDVQHSFHNVDRHHVLYNYEKIYGKVGHLIHYGGEFIGGKVEHIRKLFDGCKKVIKEADGIEGLENYNDEHITSIAVYHDLKNIVQNANAYIFRYWTQRFYLASTNYNRNKVVLWHMPAEKDSAFIYLFNYYQKKQRFPKDKKVAKLAGFPVPHQRRSFARFIMKITSGYYVKRFKKAIKIIKKRIKGEK